MAQPSNPNVAEQVKLAAEAYLYGYPLVYNLREIAKFPAGPILPSRSRFPTTRSDTPENCSTRRLISSHPTTTHCTSSRCAMYGTVRWCCMCPIRRTAITCCSSSTRGRTTLRTSGAARRVRPKHTICLRGMIIKAMCPQVCASCVRRRGFCHRRAHRGRGCCGFAGSPRAARPIHAHTAACDSRRRRPQACGRHTTACCARAT